LAIEHAIDPLPRKLSQTASRSRPHVRAR
jgi:hypothetical protein